VLQSQTKQYALPRQQLGPYKHLSHDSCNAQTDGLLRPCDDVAAADAITTLKLANLSSHPFAGTHGFLFNLLAPEFF
jgi:hypothetical protein